MRILAVDTSAEEASAACLEDGVVLSSAEADSSRRHAETVLPMIGSALRQAGWTLEDVDAFAVDIGPGSFTGVRIGVSVINAIAFVQEKPVLGVSSLKAVAEKHRSRSCPALAILDAGNGNAYAAVYRAGATETAPCPCTMQEALNLAEEPRILCGDAAQPSEIPTAQDIGKAAFRDPDSVGEMAVPLYLRPSQAERLFSERNRKKRDSDGQ